MASMASSSSGHIAIGHEIAYHSIQKQMSRDCDEERVSITLR